MNIPTKITFFTFILIFHTLNSLGQTGAIILKEYIYLGFSDKKSALDKVKFYKELGSFMSAGDILRNAHLYTSKVSELKQFRKRAVNFYKKGIKMNHPESYHRMAYMYYKGIGIEKDLKKSLEFLQESANLGCTVAQYNLGKLLLLGEELVDKNWKEAEKYLTLAANADYKKAQLDLGSLYSTPALSKGKALSLQKAIFWLEKADAWSEIKDIQTELNTYDKLVNMDTLYPSYLPNLNADIQYYNIKELTTFVRELYNHDSLIGSSNTTTVHNEIFQLYLEHHYKNLEYENLQQLAEGISFHIYSSYDLHIPPKVKSAGEKIIFKLEEKITLLYIPVNSKKIKKYILDWKKRINSYEKGMGKKLFTLREKTVKQIQYKSLTKENASIFIKQIMLTPSFLGKTPLLNLLKFAEIEICNKSRNQSTKNSKQYFDSLTTRILLYNKEQRRVILYKILFAIQPKGEKLESLNLSYFELNLFVQLLKFTKTSDSYFFINIEEFFLKINNIKTNNAYNTLLSKSNAQKIDSLNYLSNELFYGYKQQYYKQLLTRINNSYTPSTVEANIETLVLIILNFPELMHKGSNASYSNWKKSYIYIWAFLKDFLPKIYNQNLEQISKNKIIIPELNLAIKQMPIVTIYESIKQNLKFDLIWFEKNGMPNLVAWSSIAAILGL